MLKLETKIWLLFLRILGKCNSLISGLEKLGFVVHECSFSSMQVQENVVRLKILCTLRFFEVHELCTKWNILRKDEAVQ